MKKLLKKSKQAIVVLAFAVLFSVSAVSAACPTDFKCNDGGAGICNDEVCSEKPATNLIQSTTNVMMYVAGAVGIVMLIVSGMRYALAGGNEEKMKSAKNMIVVTLIGIIVVLLAWAIVQAIVAVVGQP